MPQTYFLTAGSKHYVKHLSADGQLPSQVNNLPAHYYWRQSIRDGDYEHPVMGWKLSVTPERRKQWEESFRKMLSNGVRVPVKLGHGGPGIGFVVDVRQNGPWLEELHQYLGDDAVTEALRNQVSVGIDPNFVDGRGNRYGDAIYHSAIVPDPVVPGQGQAVPVHASRGQQPDVFEFALAAAEGSTAMPMPESLQRLRDFLFAADMLQSIRATLGLGEDVEITEEMLWDKLQDYINKIRGQTQELSLSLQKEQAEHKATQEKLTAADARVLELSRNIPDSESLEALADADRAALDALCDQGRITPAVRDKLATALVRGADNKPVVFALSRGAVPNSVRLSRMVIDALKENAPVSMGTQSGVQLLGMGAVAGEQKSETNPLLETAKGMYPQAK